MFSLVPSLLPLHECKPKVCGSPSKSELLVGFLALCVKLRLLHQCVTAYQVNINGLSVQEKS